LAVAKWEGVKNRLAQLHHQKEQRYLEEHEYKFAD